MMGRINFNGCRNIDDVVRLHAEALRGKVLLECPERQPFKVTEKRTPLFGVGAEGVRAMFDTEDLDYKRVRLAFPLGLTVFTSLCEPGDIWWPKAEGDWSQWYSIDELSEDDINVDSVLRFAADLPESNLLLL